MFSKLQSLKFSPHQLQTFKPKLFLNCFFFAFIQPSKAVSNPVPFFASRRYVIAVNPSPNAFSTPLHIDSGCTHPPSEQANQPDLEPEEGAEERSSVQHTVGRVRVEPGEWLKAGDEEPLADAGQTADALDGTAKN